MYLSFSSNAYLPLRLFNSTSTTTSSSFSSSVLSASTATPVTSSATAFGFDSCSCSCSSTSLKLPGQIDDESLAGEQEDDFVDKEYERKEKESQLQVSEPSLLSAFSPFDKLCWVVRQQEDLMDSDEGVMWKKDQKKEKESEEEDDDEKEEKEEKEREEGELPGLPSFSSLSSFSSSTSSSFLSQKERRTHPPTLWTPDKHKLFLEAVRLSGGPLAPTALIYEKLVILGVKDSTPARVSSYLTKHRRSLGLVNWSGGLHRKFVEESIGKCGTSATPLSRELNYDFLTRVDEEGEEEEEEEIENIKVKSTSSSSTSRNQMEKTPKLKPSSWPPNLEKFFIEAVNKCGGPTLAKPKGVFKKLMEMGVQVRYRQVWKHLSKHTVSLGLPAGRGYFVWSTEEHNRFLEAIKRCGGIAKVSPKKLWQELSVGHEHLTRKIVAAHLNTYRVSLKQLTPLTSQPEDTDTMASSQCLKDRSEVLRKTEEKKQGERLFLEVVARLGGPKKCNPLMIFEEMNGVGAMNLRTVRRRLSRLQKGKDEGTEEEEKKEEERETTVVGEDEEKETIDNKEQTMETTEVEEARKKEETTQRKEERRGQVLRVVKRARLRDEKL